jgi:hypothetical protein
LDIDQFDSRQALHNMNSHIQRRTDELELRIRTGTEEVKLHVDRSIGEPWDQKPLRFVDAIGRRYPVPLELCQRFEVFATIWYLSIQHFAKV